MSKLETLAMIKLGPPGDLVEKFGGPRLLILFKQFNALHCTLSNLRALNLNWEILDVMQAEKEYTGS